MPWTQGSASFARFAISTCAACLQTLRILNFDCVCLLPPEAWLVKLGRDARFQAFVLYRQTSSTKDWPFTVHIAACRVVRLVQFLTSHSSLPVSVHSLPCTVTCITCSWRFLGLYTKLFGCHTCKKYYTNSLTYPSDNDSSLNHSSIDRFSTAGINHADQVYYENKLQAR